MKPTDLKRHIADNLELQAGSNTAGRAKVLAQAEELRTRGRISTTEPRSTRIARETLRDLDWLRKNLSEPGAEISLAAMINLLLRIGAAALRTSVELDLKAEAEDAAVSLSQHPQLLSPDVRQKLRAALAEQKADRDVLK